MKIEFTQNMPLRIAEDLLERKKGRDFSRVLIMIPNKRPHYYITKYLQEKLNSSFFPPDIFSIDEFIRHFSLKVNPGTRRADELNKVWILFKVAREMNLFVDYSFHHFFIWGLRIANIIDELELEEVDNKKLKNLPSEKIPQEIKNIISHLGEVKENFFNELKKNGLTTRGMDYASVCRGIGRKISLDYDLIYTAGFFSPTRLEKKILDYINGLENTIEFVQTEWKWWKFENIYLHSAFDVHSEVKRTGEILGRGFDSAKTSIVLPQADALIPLLSMVVSKLGKEYNISMGYPLKRTAPYTLLEQIMRFQETKVEDEYYAKDYLLLLLHPYVKNLSLNGSPENTRTLIHKIEERLSSESSKPFILLNEIEKDFPGVKELNLYFIKNLESVRTFQDLGSYFENLFSFILMRSNAQFYPFSGEFFEKFFEIFKDMKSSIFAKEEMDRNELFDLFRYYVNTARIPFAGIPLSGLQILGMLETRNLSFEKVVVLDVQEGVIPNEEKYDPILPVLVRRFLGLPTYREREKIFRSHFMNLVNTADEVHLIYKTGAKESRSRFIEEIIWDKEKAVGKVGIEGIVKPVNFRIETISRKPVLIKKDKKILEILKNMSFSPSSIDRYLFCPARFYFDSILGLEEREEIGREPDSGEIGTCIHKVLQKFYEPLKDREVMLTQEDWVRLKNLTVDEIRQKFGEIRGEVYLLSRIAQFRMEKFFENEKLRKNWKIISTEEDFENITIENIPGVGTLSLKGRIDRIDKREDKIYIIDYKTGEHEKPLKRFSFPLEGRKEMKNKIKSFQLPVYAYIYREKNPDLSWNDINASFYMLKRGEEDFLFSEDDDPATQMEEIFLPSLKNLLAEILNPEINFEKDEENERYCDFCPYSSFCL